MEVYIAGVDPMSMVETDGISYNIYFSGCSIRCPGCQNQELWDTTEEQKTTVEQIFEDLIVNMEIIDCVCILGGEPTDQFGALTELLKNIKDINVPVWLYTGKNPSEITDDEWDVLSEYCAVIKVGPYDPSFPKVDKLATGNQDFIITHV